MNTSHDDKRVNNESRPSPKSFEWGQINLPTAADEKSLDAYTKVANEMMMEFLKTKYNDIAQRA